MKRYIEQLIEDLREAALQAPGDPFDDENLDIEEALDMELEEVERFTSGPHEKLSYILGVPKNHLPVPDRLKDEEMGLIVPELISLLNAYNFLPEYPKEIPSAMLYRALYNIWDDEFVLMSFGTIHIEFCDYDEEECPFPGYCDLCNEINLEIDHIPENEFNVNANPLKGEEGKIDDDFNQIEKEYYKHTVITDEEGFIPGVHNYCDRWCERCDFTDKCRVWAMEIEMKKMIEEGKGDQIDDLENIIEAHEDEVDDDNDDGHDIEMELFDVLDESLEEDSDDFFSAQNKAERHPMIELAAKYTENIFQWLLARENELKNGFTAQVASGFADEVLEAEDVIGWYHVFIFAKLKRALSGFYELDEFEEADYDMNGSAKVALIGIDRSIEAATVLIRHLKEHRDTIKGFRAQLQEILLLAEEQFPDARDFIRPGLDEI